MSSGMTDIPYHLHIRWKPLHTLPFGGIWESPDAELGKCIESDHRKNGPTFLFFLYICIKNNL